MSGKGLFEYLAMTTPAMIEELTTWAQTPRTEPIDSNFLIAVAVRLNKLST